MLRTYVFATSGYVRGLTTALSKVEYPGLKEQRDGRGRKQTLDDVIRWGAGVTAKKAKVEG